MEHDEEEDIPSTVYTLADLLDYLHLSRRSCSNIRFLFYEFFNSILTCSRLPHYVDFISWAIFFFIIELIITATSIETTFFASLVPTLSNTEDRKSSDFLFSKVTIQLTTVILFALTLIIVLFQRPFSFSKKNSKMGRFRASLLQFVYVHIPIVLTPIFGILFGAHTLTNAGSEIADHSGTYYAILVAITFMALISSSSIFTAVTTFRLTITNRPFEYWVYPFTFIDFFYFFLLGSFFPMRNAPFYKVLVAMMIIQFFYGIYILVKRKKPAFVFLAAIFLETKIGFDSIFFSLLTIVNIFTPIDTLSQLSLVFVVHFIGIVLSMLICSKNRVVGQTVMKHHYLSVNRRYITSSNEALCTLRSGLMLSIPHVADPVFLKWISLWRFAPEMLPDLYRILLVKNKPLTDIIIPKTAFGPMDMIALQFLAYQVEGYMQMVADDSPALTETVDHLRRATEKLNSMLDIFWTTADYDQTTFYKLGCNILDVKNQFETALMHFPLSESIRTAYRDFLTNTLKTPRLMKDDPHNPYFYIAYPKGTVYDCLADRTKVPPYVDSSPKPTSDEKIANDTIRRGTLPLITFFRIMVVICFLTTVSFWVLYYNHIGVTWNHFANITQLQQSNVALATSVLLPTDELMNFPDAQKIQMIIGVPIGLSAIFRAPMTLEMPFSSVLQQIVNNLPESTGKFPMDISCSLLSFSSSLAYNVREDNDITHRRCALMNSLLYMEQIDNTTNDAYNVFHEYVSYNFNRETYTFIGFVGIITLIFIILFVIIRKRHDELLCAVRLVLSSKPNYHENEYLDVQFWICPTLTIFIISIAVTVCLYVSFLAPLMQNDVFIDTIINETIALSRVARGLQNGMTLSEFSIKDTTYRKEYQNMTLTQCIDVYTYVNYLTQNEISSTFSKIEPLNNWSKTSRHSYNTVLLDICRFLLQGNHSEESFDFLAARAFFMYNVSTLIGFTLPEMSQTAHYAMQSESSFFWWMTILITLVVFLLNLIYTVVLFRRKQIWFMAATTVLLRGHHGDLKSLVERKKVALPDLAPFPILIKHRKTDSIMYANPATKQYTDLSINQLIGQRLPELWSINDQKKFTKNDKTVIITEKDINNDLSMVLFEDITEISQIEDKYNMLVEQTKIKGMKLPAEIEMFAIEMRFNAEPLNSELLFELFDAAEQQCKRLIRISCGPSFYNAIVPADVKFRRVLNFLETFDQSLGNISNLKIAVVHSIGKVVSVCGDGAVALVCGRAAKRAHHCVLHGAWGRIYIDYELLEGVKMKKFASLYEKIVEISDIEKKE